MALIEAGVDAVGVNCGGGPLVCLEALVRTGPPSATVARSITPNAGLPQRIEGKFVYSAGPAYFGDMVPQMVSSGARIMGGCCGTTPEHTGAMRAAIDALVADEHGARAVAAPPPGDADAGDTDGDADGGDADGGDAAAAAAPRTPRIETPSAGDATPPSGLA